MSNALKWEHYLTYWVICDVYGPELANDMLNDAVRIDSDVTSAIAYAWSPCSIVLWSDTKYETEWETVNRYYGEHHLKYNARLMYESSVLKRPASGN